VAPAVRPFPHYPTSDDPMMTVMVFDVPSDHWPMTVDGPMGIFHHCCVCHSVTHLLMMMLCTTCTPHHLPPLPFHRTTCHTHTTPHHTTPLHFHTSHHTYHTARTCPYHLGLTTSPAHHLFLTLDFYLFPSVCVTTFPFVVCSDDFDTPLTCTTPPPHCPLTPPLPALHHCAATCTTATCLFSSYPVCGPLHGSFCTLCLPFPLTFCFLLSHVHIILTLPPHHFLTTHVPALHVLHHLHCSALHTACTLHCTRSPHFLTALHTATICVDDDDGR